ncbi:spore germination protein GerPE [Paenibacillus eucommiae]|uniref:Spore germination protein PE n=1 Tax=Paenibacillus eucommiae TaxID=1355755 RepID=A0ABS4IXT0_9BACL|nr:spore germination protein GerPE [Paenibacillus eucommiae]MBP1992389.1 spore germination protein PE [Paenibacillus eucommiae]
MKRLSIVGNIIINGISESSLLHIGDNSVIQPRSRVFAVQREVATFNEKEGNFDLYPIFSREIPQPPFLDSVSMSIDNLGSCIQVGQVRILGISTAALMQVGNTRVIDADNRTKNIRQFAKPLPAKPKGK